MNETKKLIQQITEGIQDKKGKKIVIADSTKIDDTICNYFVISPRKLSQPSDSHCRIHQGLHTQGCRYQALCRRRAAQCRMGSYGLLGHIGACLPA